MVRFFVNQIARSKAACLWISLLTAAASLCGAAVPLITHRLDVAARSDEVWVMSEGKFVERGTHEELLSRAGLYRELWSAQF